MKDYDDDIYEPSYTERYVKTSPARNNNVLYVFVITLLSLVILTLVYLYFFNKSDYEIGIEYLNKRQYDQAITEFQKVSPDDDEYILAQAKIDYINGVKLFQSNEFEKAKLYLVKIPPTDEFYNEIQLMLGKIEQTEKELELKSQLEEDEKRKILEAKLETEQKVKNEQENKRFLSFLQNIEDKFETEYQLAKLENAEAIKTNIKNLTAIKKQFIEEEYASTVPDPLLTIYKTLLNNYFNIRISVLQRAVQEKILSFEDLSLEAKNLMLDGDRIKDEIVLHKDKISQTYNLTN